MPSSFAVTASNCLSHGNHGRQLSIAPRTMRAVQGKCGGAGGILDRPRSLDNERASMRVVLGHGRSLELPTAAERPHRPALPGLGSTQADLVAWATTTTRETGLSHHVEAELRHYQTEGSLPSRPRVNEMRRRLLKLMEEKESRVRPSERASRTRLAAHRSRSSKTVGTRHRMELVGSAHDLPRGFRSTSPVSRSPEANDYGVGSAGANAFAARVALEEAESRAAKRAQFGYERYERSNISSPAPWGDT